MSPMVANPMRGSLGESLGGEFHGANPIAAEPMINCKREEVLASPMVANPMVANPIAAKPMITCKRVQ